MRRHRSVSPRCGTCLRFPAAGAARSRSPLSPRHPPSLCSVRSRSRVPSSFHPHALRHLTTRSARVRSRSQPLFSIVPGLSSEPSSQPLGGCRCALCRRNNCSVLLPPLGGSYPAQPAADPGLLLVGAGNNSTPRCLPSYSHSLCRSAHRTPGTPRCRRRLPISAPLTQLSAPIFVTVFSFLAAGSLLTYNNQLRFVTFRQTLCRLFPYGLPLGLPSRLPPRLLLHLHAIAAGRNHLQPIAGKIIQSHPVFSDFLRVISVFSSPRCPYFLAVFRFLFQQRVGTMRKTCFHKHPD